MPTIGKVQSKIQKVEGFSVNFLHSDGTDVKDNMDGIPQYPYHNAANSDWSITYWIEARFKQTYPGFDVRVLDTKGKPVNGKTSLKNVK
jgi:hypothetical protein